MPEAFKKKEKTRSPVKEENLRRSAGRSLRQKRIEIIFGEFLWPGSLVAAVGALTVIEWIRYFWPTPPMPYLMTFIFMIFIVMGVVKMWKAIKKVNNLMLAEDGEKQVGQTLEELRRFGYEVFHDIVEDEGNIDHVLIGPAGVFSVETKTRAKPAQGKTIVAYDGETISVNGGMPDRDPLVQAKACARSVRKRIKDSTGLDIRVQGVVVFPGWYVEITAKDPEVWVMNESYLTKVIQGKGRTLNDKNVGMIAGQIRMWARERQKEEVS